VWFFLLTAGVAWGCLRCCYWELPLPAREYLQ
jgi:hypothetical protein